jgi:hypothetical protein
LKSPYRQKPRRAEAEHGCHRCCGKQDEVAIGHIRPVVLQRLADTGTAIVTALYERVDKKDFYLEPELG